MSSPPRPNSGTRFSAARKVAECGAGATHRSKHGRTGAWERGSARMVLEAAGVKVAELRSRPPGNYPPECEAFLDGQWSGLEVTALQPFKVGSMKRTPGTK